jgi:signal transduction histidine kinase
MSPAPTLRSRTSQVNDPELAALLEISGAVANAGPLEEMLAIIASRTAMLVEAEAACILVIDGLGRLRLAGAHGLSAGYRDNFVNATEVLPSEAVVIEQKTFVVADTERDESWAPWRAISRREGYRGFASLPLADGGDIIGALVVYRRLSGAWSQEQLDTLELIRAHVASAVKTAQLIDDQNHGLGALARAVRGLSEQTQENVMDLQEVSALLASSKLPEVEQLIAEMESEHHAAYSAVSALIGPRILAGLLLAEMSLARTRGVRLLIDGRSSLDRLPKRLADTAAVSIVSNLLDNAFDAVATVPHSRRRVSLLMRNDANETILRVRDWGIGLPTGSDAELFKRGFTTKSHHGGIGLSLVTELVERAGGTLNIRAMSPGAAATVVVPNV